MKSSWEGILASIFHGFWSILEAKLAPSWGRKSIKKSIQKGIEKQMPKRRRLEASWRRLGPSWRRLGPKKPMEGARLGNEGGRRMRRFGGYAWGSLKAKVGLFCPSVLTRPWRPASRQGAGGLPTLAAITAGPSFSRLAFLENEFKKAVLFPKYIRGLNFQIFPIIF